MRDMKDSGIAWVGAMPSEWKIKRGKFTLKLLNRPIEETDEVITCFRDGVVTLRRNRREDGFTVSLKEIGYQGLEPGDLVIHGMDGFAGSIGISDSRGKSSPVLVVCDSDENKRYIMYYLRSMAYNDVFTALATGIRVRSCDLRWNKLAELPYILPDIREQERIVEAIESCTAKIDALTANVQAQIEKLKAYKQSVIAEVVTKGVDPTIPMKDSGIEWIGEIPAHWELTRIKNLFELRNERNDEADLSKVNLISLYTDLGVVQHSDIVETTGNRAVTAEGYKFVHKNDIVVNIILCWMGAVGMSKYDGVTSPAYDIYRPKEGTSSEYFHYLFRTKRFNGECYRYGRGIMMMRWRTYSTEFRAINIPCPPAEEQIQIVSYLNKKCSQIDRLIAIKEAKVEKLEQYKRSLIYEYVTGKKEVTA